MMNEKETRKYEMLARVRDFSATHASAFATGTLAASLLAEIESAIERLSDHSATQSAGAAAVREGSASRRLARETLRDDLEVISRTARALADEMPPLREKFRLPPTGRDQALLDAARAFAADAEPHAAEFARHELGEEFFAKLEADIAAFERALAAQRRGRETRIAATAAIDDAIDDGVRAVRRLDTIVRNKFAADPVALQAWTSASRTWRSSHPARAPQSEPAAS
jgi:hypothetical protein